MEIIGKLIELLPVQTGEGIKILQYIGWQGIFHSTSKKELAIFC